MRATLKNTPLFFWLLPFLLAWALLAAQPVSLKTTSGQNSGLDTASTASPLWQAAPRLSFSGLAEKEAAGPLVGVKGGAALNDLKNLPQFAGKTQFEIEATLKAQGYTSVPANSGGSVWTKSFSDGNTAAVRIDPAVNRPNPKGWADEVPHVHKEVVPTSEVKSGNYKPSQSVTTLDDYCCASTNKADIHIQIH